MNFEPGGVARPRDGGQAREAAIAPPRQITSTNPYAPLNRVVLPETQRVVGTGWLPPPPDMRDYTQRTPEVREMADKLGLTAANIAAVPTRTDLRAWCSPIDDQGQLGSCTAHAAVGIVEYFQNRSKGSYIEGSRLFVYKATRDLMNVQGDTGAFLRTTMAALTYFGVPPEEYWPYTTATEPGPGAPRTFDDEPRTFVYELADDYEALRYFRHDAINTPPEKTLASLKQYLAAGVPAMFGFFGFDSFTSTNVAGGIPYPCPGEAAKWGHAIAAVGYDDSIKITNTKCKKETIGALLIRNSWGTSWGEKGYGYLPYQYVLDRLASDFWSLLDMEWIDTEQFGLSTQSSG